METIGKLTTIRTCFPFAPIGQPPNGTQLLSPGPLGRIPQPDRGPQITGRAAFACRKSSERASQEISYRALFPFDSRLCLCLCLCGTQRPRLAFGCHKERALSCGPPDTSSGANESNGSQIRARIRLHIRLAGWRPLAARLSSLTARLSPLEPRRLSAGSSLTAGRHPLGQSSPLSPASAFD